MPKIFISYRREDSKHAVGRLHAALRRHVSNPARDIFMDVDNIPRGVDFVEHLDQKVAECDVMLAVIGPSWISIKDPVTQHRRLDDPQDFVRVEVASALKRNIAVVPVVLDDTPLPSAAQLPDDLKALARRNGERLDHESFDSDVARLIRNLPDMKVERKRKAPPASVGGPSRGSAWIAPTVVVIVLALAGAGVWIADPFGWRTQTLDGDAIVESGDGSPMAEATDAVPPADVDREPAGTQAEPPPTPVSGPAEEPASANTSTVDPRAVVADPNLPTIKEAEARVSADRAMLSVAERDEARLKALVERGVASSAELENAHGRVQQAKTALAESMRIFQMAQEAGR
jgi:hypothetical protein